ncbi:hypothetical protein [Salmonirosea aquatica]|uniref:Uncharacterized protein n=1 Tax=Salmonirosea aquatica TaxID=2654236 RepID=A0A7C9FYU0_9BACT|nr:hypothetical protein [Cytophagaceae bacterium SJW1-29]
MIVELIPVIEIGYNNQDVPTPEKFPYWEYPELWDKYKSDSYNKAGFIDDLKPYLKGSSFYRLSEVTDNNLKKLISDHTQELRDGKYEREQASALFGGYVLRIDGQDKYFPQCCGDLADLQYWENLGNGKEKGFYAGHPEPEVKIQGDKITFDFTVGEFDEHFAPTPSENVVQFDIASLRKAIEIVKTELDKFEQRLEKINQDEKLNIDNIGRLLIWDNANYQ